MSIRNDIFDFGRRIAKTAGQYLSDFGSDNLSKAVLAENVNNVAIKAPTEEASDDPKSLFWDPFAIVEQLGYKEKSTSITYGTLLHIAWKMDIVRAIIQTRINQVASFCVPHRDQFQVGYKISLRDKDREPTKIEIKELKRFENLIMSTGVTDDPRDREDFETFVRKLMFDSLVYDQMCFEVVPNRKGLPAAWYAVDASTIRRADSAYQKTEDEIKYVQIYDSIVIQEYTNKELCFGIRNPSTNIRLYGYGTSELEMLVQTVTALLFAQDYNRKFFSQGSTPKGIINFKGPVPLTQLKQFRRHWYQMVSGVENAWRTPIMNSDDIQYINLQQSSRDMEFNAWMDFLIKIACSMYQIDPSEVNFKYGNTGQRSTLNESNNREKITESKERRLRPLLRFLSKSINNSIIWPLNPDLEFEFVGLDAKTPMDLAELRAKKVKTYCTVDQIRAEDDQSPLPNGLGEVILDPTWLQWAQIKMAQQQQVGRQEEGPGSDSGGSVDYESLLAQYDAENGEKASESSEMSSEANSRNIEKNESKIVKSFRGDNIIFDLEI